LSLTISRSRQIAFLETPNFVSYQTLMQQPSNRVLFIIATVSLSLVVVALSMRLPSRPKRVLSKEVFKRVIEQLCEAFVAFLVEPAQCVQRADMLASQRTAEHDSRFGLTGEEMAALLMEGGVGEGIEAIQERIFREANVTSEEIETATESFAEDESVAELLQSLDETVATFLSGGIPVNPVAEPLDSEKETLAVLKDVVELKQERISDFLISKTDEWPSPETAKRLAEMARQAETDACAKHGVTHRDLLASVAVGTNKSRTFRKNLVALLFKHQSVRRLVDHRS